MIRQKTLRGPTLYALFAVVLAACGGGGGGGGDGGDHGNSSGTLAPPIADLTGDWDVTESGTSNCPGEETYAAAYRVSVAQNGNALTVITPAGTFSGNISGASLSWKGSYQEDGGTTEITSMTLTVASAGTHFSGSSNWKWSDGTLSCSGTTQAINGTRVAAASTPPPVPTAVSATAQSDASILVQWGSATQPGSGFKIERQRTGRGPFEEVGSAPRSATSYLDQGGLTASTNYSYRVRSYDGDRYSDYSEIASATTVAPPDNVPADPSQLRAEEATVTTIRLYWLDNASSETGYQIERSTSADAGFGLIHTASANSTSHTDTGLASATQYFYRVRAAGTAGNSGYSNVANTRTLVAPSAPAAPTAAQATSTGGTAIRLQWLDNSQDETGFKIERSLQPATGFSQIRTTAPDTTSLNDIRLTPSTTYYYRVRATRSEGGTDLDSDYSNVASVTTPAPTPTSIELAATVDTLLLVSSTNPAAQDAVYGDAENAVGCNWLYSTYTEIQDYVCAASAIYFSVPVDSRPIRSATLKLSVQVLPADTQSTLELRAIASNWSPATMTWDWFDVNGRTWTSPLVRSPPPASAQIPMEFDVTAIARNWINGTWSNYGLLLGNVQADYMFPNATALRAVGFDSLEVNSGAARRPQLVLEYE